MPRPHTKKDLIEAADLNYGKLLNLLDSMTEIELSTEFDFSSDAKKIEVHWVGGSTIGSYFVSVTSSHYDWAMKKLKAHRKMLNVK